MPTVLYLLALAVFAMGTSEFMLAGLLPDIAATLDVSLGAAGLLTSAFAAGMVLGAPVTAALARRWPPRATLLAFLLAFAATHVVGALATTFPVLLATRVLAALANAGFLAVALTTVTTLVAPGRHGRALAVLLSGTTLATVAGVPGGAVVGTLLGWRATFWTVALLCVPTAIALLGRDRLRRPAATAAPGLRDELARLARPRLAVVMLLGALVNAATFATFTYLGPIVTGAAGLAGLWVAVTLVLFGLGSFAGVTVAGRLADRRPGLVVAVGGPLALLGWVALALLAGEPAALLVLAFTQGALSFAVGATLIARVLHEAAGAPTMGGAYATSALNLGAVGGPLLAGAALGGGVLGPAWVSAGLVAAALAVALVVRLVVAAVSRGRQSPAGRRGHA